MKHILFLTQWYPSRVTGQSGNFIQRHAECAALQNKVTVLFAFANAELKEQYSLDIKKKKKNLVEIRVFFRPSKNRVVHLFRKIQALTKGYKRVAAFDLIHLNITYPIGLFALFLCVFFGKKYVLTEHWTGFVRQDLRIPRWKRFWMRLIGSKAAVILPVSENLGKAMQRFGLKAKYIVIPNVVDGDVFTHRHKARESKRQKTILHVSSLKDEQKNISGMRNLLDELNKVRQDFNWEIMGLQSKDWFTNFVKDLEWKERIRFHPYARPSHVAERMRQADLFLLLSRFENQPCVIAEAFASGLPVVSTNIGGVSEFFPEGFGVILNDDENTWLMELNRALDMEFAQPKEMTVFANQNFSSRAIGAKLNEVYSKVLSAK